VNSEKGTLIVSSGGLLEGNITVATVKINGTVKGDIIATERIEFGRTAQVHGNIRTPALIIERGAVFEGNCRMETGSATIAPKPRAFEAQPKKPVEKEVKVIIDKVRPISTPAVEATT
jgi:cytoskeletal protein CcmA (bactofilin family)